MPDSIKQIREAGINLWVLTGDKIETAINIGYSAGLLDETITRLEIESALKNDIDHKINEESKDKFKSLGLKQKAVVIAGDALTTVQSEPQLEKDFLALTD